jgi:hypothetical protein
LENFQSFVTQYGVAQLIKDDRATPEVELSLNFKKQLRTWNNWRIKRSINLSKKKINFSVFSLVRRRLLREAYDSNNVTQDTVFKAYFGEDPRKIAPTDYPKAIKTTADPKLLKPIPMNQLVHTPNE